jgi:hypothetical protein
VLIRHILRNFDVKAMRRMEPQHWPAMRRDHHSATSFVPRDDDPVPVVARAGAPEHVKPDTTEKPPKRVARRHHAKNEERAADAPSKPMPRFKRDAVPTRKRSGSTSESEVVARKQDATSSDIARKDEQGKRDLYNGTVSAGGGHKGGDKPGPEKRDTKSGAHTPPPAKPPINVKRTEPAPSGTPNKVTETKREEVKEPAMKREETKREPIKPIALFR